MSALAQPSELGLGRDGRREVDSFGGLRPGDSGEARCPDAPAVAAIYAPHVIASVASFET